MAKGKIISKINGKKLYKVITNSHMSCNGGQFDWAKYLPKDKKKGKWTPPTEHINPCNIGYHVTTNPEQWFSATNKIFEAEGKGEYKTDDNQKFVFHSVRLVKPKTCNTGKDNTGCWNSGDSNSGDSNSGDSNSGDRNSGDSNSGDSNSGDRNSGYRNSGYSNSGYRNSGYSNSGDSNSGDRNSGYRNSGYSNSGDRNSGDRNSGYRNSGAWNGGSYHTGFFNTTKQPPFLMFNRQCNKKRGSIYFPQYFYDVQLTEWIWYTEDEMNDDQKKRLIEGELKTHYYKKAWKKAFENTSGYDVAKTLKLPNFNYKIFQKITGITKRMMDKKLKE